MSYCGAMTTRFFQEWMYKRGKWNSEVLSNDKTTSGAALGTDIIQKENRKIPDDDSLISFA